MSTIVLGVIGSDAHVVGITIIEHALKDAGYTVENIGVQSSQEDFIAAANRVNADAILVSSLYGHAEQDCEGFCEQVDRTIYIGGNLAVGQEPFEITKRRFREMGFDRVFDSSTDVEEILSALSEDLTSTEDEQVKHSV